MIIRVPLIASLLFVANVVVFGQTQAARPPRSITLAEALDLAL